MKNIILIVCLGLVAWIRPATAEQDHALYSLKVSIHKDVRPLTREQVEEILERASSLLQKKSEETNATDNVPCDVTFKLDGPIGTFETSAPKDINDADDLEAVQREPADVKVVDKINFCMGRHDSFIGCSWRPEGRLPKTMIIARSVVVDLRHFLWAHEFGHTTGLQHRVDDPMALMTPCDMELSNGHISKNECSCFLKGQGGCPISEQSPACPLKNQN